MSDGGRWKVIHVPPDILRGPHIAVDHTRIREVSADSAIEAVSAAFDKNAHAKVPSTTDYLGHGVWLVVVHGISTYYAIESFGL